ncbi:hypothetical protein C0Z11_00770 [Acidipropionibacterium jensenii]|nr:phage holin family protein [Acidipropionibacterium jensenii]AZZ41059.1 hypothetical protein C0Z11_00770 [Acidipropionibacterium jensenii]
MIRFVIRAAIFLATAAIGLVVAALSLHDFRVTISGFLLAVIVFAVVQSVLAPFIFKMASRYASSLLGAAGLISTYVALLVASSVSHGLTIRGFSTWVFGTLIVWIVTMFGAWLLPLIFIKKKVAG